MDDLHASRPTSFQRLLFWAILGGLSVFFAEVSIGSYPFPFTNVWGLLVVCPLYLLHLLVLGYVVLARRRPRLSALFFAGALFGLYEAYMTKQLWNPDWSPDAVRVGGIAVLPTIVLVLWWHATMAFFVPLLVAETALGGSRDVARALPRPVRRALFGRRGTVTLCALAAALGCLHSSIPTNTPTAAHVAASSMLAAAVVLALAALYRWRTRGRRFPLRALLPTGREMVLLCVCLALMYGGLGMLLRPEALPPLGPQATVWLLYVFFGTVLWLALRSSPRVIEPELPEPARPFPWRLWFALAGIYVATSLASRLLLGRAAAVFALANLAVGAAVGVTMLIASVYDVVRITLARARGRRSFADGTRPSS